MGLFDSTAARRRRTAHHEARHIVVARHLGATDLEGHVSPDGASGYFTGDFDGSREQEAVILLAGGGTTSNRAHADTLPHGGDSDLTQARRLLADSDMTMRDAEREAARMVRRHADEISRAAQDLLGDTS
ncbi:hypothetical protein [Parafrankia sp. FMc2]|uniref:hypothetical protein n=1 Tax=Parafrankia sp. FMc2 TaxID=3233196 RepID=UPI0034D514F1